MRSSLTWLASLAFVVACADVPTGPLMHQPQVASFAEEDDDPPPPWQRVSGTMTIDEGTATVSYTANFLASPNDNVAWLKFTGGTGVSFSAGARIMSVNGNVTGTGTFTVGTTTYRLNTVSSFTFDGDCTSTSFTTDRTPSCASFGGSGFRSEGSLWTGVGPSGKKTIGKPGDGGGGEVCTISAECYKR